MENENVKSTDKFHKILKTGRENFTLISKTELFE